MDTFNVNIFLPLGQKGRISVGDVREGSGRPYSCAIFNSTVWVMFQSLRAAPIGEFQTPRLSSPLVGCSYYSCHCCWNGLCRSGKGGRLEFTFQNSKPHTFGDSQIEVQTNKHGLFITYQFGVHQFWRNSFYVLGHCPNC